MPRFKVVEIRAYRARYLVDADTEEQAKRLEGRIVEGDETDDWGQDMESVEQVADDEELD